MRKRFKTTMICSTSNYELTIKVHHTMYSDRWDEIQAELKALRHVDTRHYVMMFGSKVYLNSEEDIKRALDAGFKVY